VQIELALPMAQQDHGTAIQAASRARNPDDRRFRLSRGLGAPIC
jgi:hypothetical protein